VTPERDDSWDRSRRLSFGAGAAAYDRFRPRFPPEAIAWGLGPMPLTVLDLGAGTGLMTQALAGADHRVIAVEPDPLMRVTLRGRVGARCDVLEGSAEAIPVPDSQVDCVVSAESFHWFDLSVALGEIARVLRPNGRLLIVWNVRVGDMPWVAELEQILAASHPGSAFDEGGLPDVRPWFGDLEEARFPYLQTLDEDGLVGLVGTFSYVALSPHREQILDQVAHLARTHPDLAGHPTFALPYATRVIRCTRVTQAPDGLAST